LSKLTFLTSKSAWLAKVFTGVVLFMRTFIKSYIFNSTLGNKHAG
jgi:hypothetical protein